MAEMNVTIDSDARSVLVAVKGRASLTECIAMVEKLTSSAEFDPSYRVLGDVREIDFAPSVKEAQALSRLFQAKRERYANGLGVLVGSPLIYGLTRMINLFSGQQAELIAPFLDEAEAFAWLAAGAD